MVGVVGLVLGVGDAVRLGLMRILCSNKGETEVGSLAMACRPEWPADYFQSSKTDRDRCRQDGCGILDPYDQQLVGLGQDRAEQGSRSRLAEHEKRGLDADRDRPEIKFWVSACSERPIGTMIVQAISNPIELPYAMI